MLIAFDPDNKLHQDLFNEFLKTINCYDSFYCKYDSCIEEASLVLRDLVVEQFDADSAVADEPTDSIAAVIKKDPNDCLLIIALDYMSAESFETDENPRTFFLKASGSILIENNKSVVWEIDISSLDFSNKKEFNRFWKLNGNGLGC